MILNKIIFLLFLTFAFSSNNPWGGISVSTTDNLDATSMNPAGFGINRGEQSGFFIPIDEDKPFSIHAAARGDGWGYSLYYGDVNNIDIFNQFIEDYRRRFDFSKCTHSIHKLDKCFFNNSVESL